MCSFVGMWMVFVHSKRFNFFMEWGRVAILMHPMMGAECVKNEYIVNNPPEMAVFSSKL